ncbi:MAG: tetratricopeptide repeat protein [Fuerstiella sp.]|nr:tetratricopeptide repeat protein [Fuerstiella sp.]
MKLVVRPLRCATAAVLFFAVGYGLMAAYVHVNAHRTVLAADQALMNGDAVAAREEIAWLLWFKPNHARGLYLQAMSQQMEGNYPAAIDSFEKSLAADYQKDAGLRQQLSIAMAVALLRDHQLDRAEIALREHLNQYPLTDIARDELAELYHSQLRNDTARELLEERWRLLPHDLSVLPDLLVIAEARNANEVVAHYEEINRKRPGQTSVVLALGFACWQMGETERGRRFLEEAVQLNPDHPRVRLIVADYLVDDGDVTRAETLLNGLGAEQPNSQYWSVRSRIEEQRKQYQQAMASIDRALAANAFDRTYRYRKARLYQRLGKSAEATELHEQVSQLASSWFDLGIFAVRWQGDTVPSADDCRKIADLYATVGKQDYAAAWRRLIKSAVRIENQTRGGSGSVIVDPQQFYFPDAID